MEIERDERKFDFHDIGLAIKKAREREGLTQEQLAFIVDRDTRTIMYHENDGQHPNLNSLTKEKSRLLEGIIPKPGFGTRRHKLRYATLGQNAPKQTCRGTAQNCSLAD